MIQALTILAAAILLWGGLFAFVPGLGGHDRRAQAIPLRVHPRRR